MANEKSSVQGVIVGLGGQQTFQGPVTVWLRDMKQAIQDNRNADEDAKAELLQLMDQLRETLKRVPAEKEVEAKQVALRAEELVSEVTQERPDKETVDFKGSKLKQAAENLREVMPIVTQIALGIVASIARFVTGTP
jgi:flagellar motility protein MotE (MotC chaperone)